VVLQKEVEIVLLKKPLAKAASREMLCSGMSSDAGMKRGVEGAIAFEHAIANMQELPHGRRYDNHFGFSAPGKALAEGLDRRIVVQRRNRREVESLSKARTPPYRQRWSIETLFAALKAGGSISSRRM